MNFKTIKILIFVLSVLHAEKEQSQWLAQNSGTIGELKSVQFLDENTGFICGRNLLLKSTDGGQSWQNNFLQGNHNRLFFSGNNIGYICSDSGRIYKTINGGANWIPQNTNTISDLTSIKFLNTQTGIVTGKNKTFMKTTNGGITWINASGFIWQIDLLDCKIIDENIFYLSGTDSYILKTTNGGLNWAEYTRGMVNPLFTIDFINSNTGFATGCCGMFLTTTNSGVNWIDNNYLSLGFSFHSMQFVSSLKGYLAGDNGMIYRTTNGGLWWDSTVTGTDQILYSLFMVNETTGWAVGNYGTILKTTNGGGIGYTIGIEQVSSEMPKHFMLSQNYPNPFNPSTKIRFEIPPDVKGRYSNTKLSIYDLTGKEISILIDELLHPGVYEFNWSASGLPSGFYFCVLNSGVFMETRKIILIK